MDLEKLLNESLVLHQKKYKEELNFEVFSFQNEYLTRANKGRGFYSKIIF